MKEEWRQPQDLLKETLHRYGIRVALVDSDDTLVDTYEVYEARMRHAAYEVVGGSAR